MPWQRLSNKRGGDELTASLADRAGAMQGYFVTLE